MTASTMSFQSYKKPSSRLSMKTKRDYGIGYTTTQTKKNAGLLYKPEVNSSCNDDLVYPLRDFQARYYCLQYT